MGGEGEQCPVAQRVLGGPNKINKKYTVVLGPLTVPCPWAPEGLATSVLEYN